MKQTDKQAKDYWVKYRKALFEDTAVDINLTQAQITKKRIELEKHPVKWMRYFFPKFAYAAFAPFQIKAIKRLTSHMEWYEVLSWSRELAKSTITMMIVLFLVLTGKKKNIILVSNSYDNAERLLEPYQAQLDSNQRIKAFYGDQKQLGHWESGDFQTQKGAAFRALGAGQSPRGTRNDAIRPDVLLVDDFDTDEECRNPDIVKQKWEWLEQALYFTRSMSQPLLSIFCGNIIAKDCAITRAGKKALELAKRPKEKGGPLGNWDIINIRMVKIGKPDPQNDFLYGTSVWPEKNSEEQIDVVLSQVSQASAMKECFNNPLSEGETFKEMRWGKVPPLSRFRHLVAYADPAPSNSKNKAGSFKSLFLIGHLEGTFYVFTGFLDHVTNAEFVDWFYCCDKYVAGKAQVYYAIENNKLQDPFYQQVFIPLFATKRKEHKYSLSISPDTRDKPDKFSRIEGNLEPLNREGRLILNEKEKGNPHMQRLEEQFLLVNPRLAAPADGPDCVEGGYFIANTKAGEGVPMRTAPRKRSRKRY